MRFLYVAPRYHTNQIPIMEGLKRQGHFVAFFSHYAGKIEDYSCITPEIIGYSPVFLVVNTLYVKVFHKKNAMAGDWKLRFGFPSVFKIYRKMKAVHPDVVIIRERSVYSIITYLVCRMLRLKTILYNQSPVYEKTKEDTTHRIIKKLTPKVRMTPVLGSPGPDKGKESSVFFVPFVMGLKCEPSQKKYCPGGVVRIFTVGKYEKRKNLLMIARVVKQLCMVYNIHLTIAGECSKDSHRMYYAELRKYIEENHLEDAITLRQNLSREEMDAVYEKTDLFVLPSTLEPASISQLEAMAFSIPVICSDSNGSACYVENGHNGYLFKDNEEECLKEAMEKLIRDPVLLMKMGRNSYQDVKEKYQFENYYEGIMECIRYEEEYAEKSK
ncbi:MAG: glycosyltransferase family 4 protein [Lachnospiraceae bacterium]|nr:glycosyltransferase family 4 protein [Lachnospiraceae bacterium]